MRLPWKDSFVGNDWSFLLKASATQIHRWDLTEQSDNPRLTATLQGRWNVALKKISAESLLLESPSSNLHGTALFRYRGHALYGDQNRHRRYSSC